MTSGQSAPRAARRGWLAATVALCLGSLAIGLVLGFAAGRETRSPIPAPPQASRRSARPSPGASPATQPTHLAGAALDVALPVGYREVDRSVDDASGSWWYASGSDADPEIYVSTLRYDGPAPAIDDAYFRQTVLDIEDVSSPRDVAFEGIEAATVDGYRARRGAYRSLAGGDAIYAAALLIGREEDDVVVEVYGPVDAREAVDRLADALFASLRVGPTPPSYSPRSASAAGARRARAA